MGFIKICSLNLEKINDGAPTKSPGIVPSNLHTGDGDDLDRWGLCRLLLRKRVLSKTGGSRCARNGQHRRHPYKRNAPCTCFYVAYVVENSSPLAKGADRPTATQPLSHGRSDADNSCRVV